VLAPRSPADCFDTALEAARIALTYRTPVFLLSDGYIANGSEPWLLPDVASMPDLTVPFATEPNGPDGKTFLPYLRDPQTLARPWAIPGTPGLEHRIGGIEKAEGTGDISYDPDNHHRMALARAARIDSITVPDLEVDDPDGGATTLVLGWGSTYGPIGAACRSLRERGLPIAQAHLRHLNPMPANLGVVLASYDRVVVPELNLGQLAQVLRSRYLVDVIGYNQVRGLPFTAAELEAALEQVVPNQVVPDRVPSEPGVDRTAGRAGGPAREETAEEVVTHG
jgi:2-oxoglutarate ferredoxin oxidoreductase subunit alpha